MGQEEVVDATDLNLEDLDSAEPVEDLSVDDLQEGDPEPLEPSETLDLSPEDFNEVETDVSPAPQEIEASPLPEDDEAARMEAMRRDLEEYGTNKFKKGLDFFLDASGLPDPAIKSAIYTLQTTGDLAQAIDAATEHFEKFKSPGAPDVITYKQILYRGALDMGIPPKFGMQGAAALGPVMDFGSSMAFDFSNLFGAGPGRAIAKKIVEIPTKTGQTLAKAGIRAINALDKETLPKYLKRFREIETSRSMEDIASSIAINFEDMTDRAFEGARIARHTLDDKILKADEFIDIYEQAIDSVGVGSRVENRSGKFVVISDSKKGGIPQTRETGAAKKYIKDMWDGFERIVDDNGNVSQHRVKDLIQEIDDAIRKENKLGVGETDKDKALMFMRQRIDDVLKAYNPEYRARMAQIDQDFDAMKFLSQTFALRKDGSIELSKKLGERLSSIGSKGGASGKDKIMKERFALQKLDSRMKSNFLQEIDDRAIFDRMNAAVRIGSRAMVPAGLLGAASFASSDRDIGDVGIAGGIAATGWLLDTFGRKITRQVLSATMRTEELRQKYVAHFFGIDWKWLGKNKATEAGRTVLRALRPGFINAIIRQHEGESLVDKEGYIKLDDQATASALEFAIAGIEDLSTRDKMNAIEDLRKSFVENEGLKIKIAEFDPASERSKPEVLRAKSKLIDLNRAFGMPKQDDEPDFLPQVPGLPYFGGNQ